jgi:hypothetical protein
VPEGRGDMKRGDKIRVPRSEEHKRRLSVSMRGNRNQEKARSMETRLKISNAMRDNKNTFGKTYGVVTREKDRFHKIGTKNPCWQGGISFEPYSPQFNILFRKKILKRDQCTCQLCRKKPQDIRKLHPHHIDYDKKNCEEDNLITLCHSCHSKTNHNRQYWMNYFKELKHG